MNKKILAALTAAAMAAASFGVMPVMAENEITVSVDGKQVEFDQAPIIDNDRTLVPMRKIFEALGATVDWNGETRTVTSVKGDTTISLTIDSADMYVGDKKVTLDVPAKIVNDRTLVPVRAISEAMSCKVDWDGEKRAVIITSAEEPAATPAARPDMDDNIHEGPKTGTGAAGEDQREVPKDNYGEAMQPKAGVNTYVPSLVVGEIDPATGEVSAAAEEKSTTNFVPVNGGKKYFAALYHPNAEQYSGICTKYAFFDKDKKYISGAEGDMSKLVSAPANAAFIRYTIELPIRSRNKLYVCFMETDKAPTTFEKSEVITKKAKTADFADKSIYLIGDTIANNNDAWLTYMDEDLNAKSFKIKAEDGLKYTGSTGVALGADSYQSGLAKDDFDVVIVAAGTYDWMQNVKMADFEKAVPNVISKLQSKYKNAKIYLMTIPTGKNAASFEGGIKNESGSTNADYSAAIKKAAEKAGVGVIDVASLWGTSDVEKYMRATTGDLFLFANEEGSRLMSDEIFKTLTK